MEERIVLGENCVYTTDCGKTGLNNNRIVVGTSGCGKTVSLMEPELMETTCVNKIFEVTKRRIAEKYTELLEKRGYKVYILDFANPENANCSFDPVIYMKKEEDITDTATSIVMANERKIYSNADPFWDDAGVSLLAAETALTLMTAEKATFADVLETHYKLEFEDTGNGIETSFDTVFERIRKINPENYAVKCWRTFRESAPKTAKSIFVTMNVTLDKMFTTSIRNMMKTKPGIDFEKMATEKTVIFVITSPVNKVLHCLANMFLAQAVKELFEIAEKRPDGKLPIPVHISFDDFATGCRVASFPEYISIFREKGISCTLLLQSISQLKKIYGEYDAISILDNCDTYIYMGGNNIETARDISLRLNAPLEEVLYMPIGQEIIFRRGQFPIVTKRYDIMKNELYQEITNMYEKQIFGKFHQNAAEEKGA